MSWRTELLRCLTRLCVNTAGRSLIINTALAAPTSPSSLSFDVSLTCGRDSEKEEPLYDVALKLSARFSDRQFLRSARVSGKWTGEEASTAYFPFIPDQPFRVKRAFCISDQVPNPLITSPLDLSSAFGCFCRQLSQIINLNPKGNEFM